MSALRLGPVIGTLGGSKVETIDVDATASGGRNSVSTVHTLDVPAGEPCLVAVHGHMTAASNSNPPSLGFSGESGAMAVGPTGLATVGSGQVTLQITRGASNSEDRFVGKLYVVRL